MKVLIPIILGLLVVGCGGDGKQGGDSLEYNQSSTETPPAKSLVVPKIDLGDKETRDKIIAEAIDADKLEASIPLPSLNGDRKKQGEAFVYVTNPQKPYTGWSKSMHDNGQIERLIQYKNGKMDGLAAAWYSNGQKSSERTTKDDKVVTIVVWKRNGEKCSVTNFVNGNGVVVSYKDDGTENYRNTYKDGENVDIKFPD